MFRLILPELVRQPFAVRRVPERRVPGFTHTRLLAPDNTRLWGKNYWAPILQFWIQLLRKLETSSTVVSFLCWHQCDQIGLFLKSLGNKYTYKITTNIW